jgi:hypothetical protein
VEPGLVAWSAAHLEAEMLLPEVSTPTTLWADVGCSVVAMSRSPLTSYPVGSGRVDLTTTMVPLTGLRRHRLCPRTDRTKLPSGQGGLLRYRVQAVPSLAVPHGCERSG